MSPRKKSLRTAAVSQRKLAHASWVRTPIALIGRLLRILIYSRYSTEEQNPRSIDDQVAFCKRFLQGLLGDVPYQVKVLFDEGISGEIVSRPGIDEAYAGILEHRWDLIVCEDASRLYRHETACGEFVESAVDEGVRVFCINDFVDTAEEDWEDRLHEAMRHHARSNRYTSRRIKRAHDGLWEIGAAVNPLRTGHIRRPSKPATTTQPAQGPFFDEIDPKWVPIIHEAYVRIAARDLPEAVGAWLTQVGLPKMANAKSSAWTAKNVIALIRRLDYRGLQEFRHTVSKKQYRSGKHKQERNDPNEVLQREMPHLRIVSDHLWDLANAAIDARCTTKNRLCGRDHPLYGVPRGTTTPLSSRITCVCEQVMQIIGKNGFRCRNVDGEYKQPACWNRATAKVQITHDAVADALQQHFNAHEPSLSEAMAQLQNRLGEPNSREHRRKALQQERQEAEAALNNLANAIEGKSEPPETLLRRIDEREDGLRRVIAELEDIDRDNRTVCLPAAEEMASKLGELVARLRTVDRSVWGEVGLVVLQLRAFPCQQFDTNKVVLRGRLEVNLAGLLPPSARLALMNLQSDDLPQVFRPATLEVNLFEPSTGPEHGMQAAELAELGIGPTEIGKRLKITKRNACLAIEYGRKLRAAGVTNPYIPLTDPPAAASRWGSRDAKA
jgi:DNA invertase Pin-like site-specific DNA recombinase